MTSPDDVHAFWIGSAASDPIASGSKNKLWFMSSPAADNQIREKFGNLLREAEQGKLNKWSQQPISALALVILLDQFSRNLYRGTASAFKNDPHALDVSRSLVNSGQDKTFKPIERVFLYLPFEHAEVLEIQQQSVSLFQKLALEAAPEWQPQLDAFADHAVEHKNIIARFGRFPHRNKVLGRTNTAEETTFLKNAKTFGQ